MACIASSTTLAANARGNDDKVMSLGGESLIGSSTSSPGEEIPTPRPTAIYRQTVAPAPALTPERLAGLPGRPVRADVRLEHWLYGTSATGSDGPSTCATYDTGRPWCNCARALRQVHPEAAAEIHARIESGWMEGESLEEARGVDPADFAGAFDDEVAVWDGVVRGMRRPVSAEFGRRDEGRPVIWDGAVEGGAPGLDWWTGHEDELFEQAFQEVERLLAEEAEEDWAFERAFEEMERMMAEQEWERRERARQRLAAREVWR